MGNYAFFGRGRFLRNPSEKAFTGTLAPGNGGPFGIWHSRLQIAADGVHLPEFERAAGEYENENVLKDEWN